MPSTQPAWLLRENPYGAEGGSMPRLIMFAVIALSLLAAAPLAAQDGAYRIDIGASEQHGGSLRFEPRVAGPPGKLVRYEMNARSHSPGAGANSSRSGSVRLDDSGKAQLPANAVKLAPAEQYEMSVKLFEGNRLVAEESTQRP
jgi:hypothetical protein